MAMGRRQREQQQELWIDATQVSQGPSHPFYKALNKVLDKAELDSFVEEICRPFYAEVMGRPSLAPAVYFRLLLIGFFEGIDSERGIAWRVADSLSLRNFLGLARHEDPPDHSTISRTRRLIAVETHSEVFCWVLKVLAKRNLLKGKTLGIDGTSLEANAALRSIVRRDSGTSYDGFLTELAKASGIETPSRSDLAQVDRKRPKKGSNDDWQHPLDPDAKITKMKDGRTHLAHKAEHVVDMETGAVLAVTIQNAVRGDTRTLEASVAEARGTLEDLLEDPEVAEKLSHALGAELVADKGYHCNEVLRENHELGIRTYISEPKRGRRNWKKKPEAKIATYANRRRIRGKRGQALLRRRGEILERTFAHCYETGGMRRTHLRGHPNILKRLLIHVAGFNLSLVMRELFPSGKPRGLQGLSARLLAALAAVRAFLGRLLRLQAASATILLKIASPSYRERAEQRLIAIH